MKNWVDLEPVCQNCAYTVEGWTLVAALPRISTEREWKMYEVFSTYFEKVGNMNCVYTCFFAPPEKAEARRAHIEHVYGF